MGVYERVTKSEDETKKLAFNLATLLHPGDVITLEGDLGAGKTTFTKGLAKGLAIDEIVSSPTFTIVKEYEGTIPLYHMDVYRLEHSDEDIGFLEYFHGDGVSVIEWAQYINDYLPNERLTVTIEYVGSEMRKLTFKPIGKYYEKILKKLFDDQVMRSIRDENIND